MYSKEKGWCVGRNTVENVVESPEMDARPDLETIRRGGDIKGGGAGGFQATDGSDGDAQTELSVREERSSKPNSIHGRGRRCGDVVDGPSARWWWQWSWDGVVGLRRRWPWNQETRQPCTVEEGQTDAYILRKTMNSAYL